MPNLVDLCFAFAVTVVSAQLARTCELVLIEEHFDTLQAEFKVLLEQHRTEGKEMVDSRSWPKNSTLVVPYQHT